MTTAANVLACWRAFGARSRRGLRLGVSGNATDCRFGNTVARNARSTPWPVAGMASFKHSLDYRCKGVRSHRLTKLAQARKSYRLLTCRQPLGGNHDEFPLPQVAVVGELLPCLGMPAEDVEIGSPRGLARPSALRWRVPPSGPDIEPWHSHSGDILWMPGLPSRGPIDFNLRLRQGVLDIPGRPVVAQTPHESPFRPQERLHHALDEGRANHVAHDGAFIPLTEQRECLRYNVTPDYPPSSSSEPVGPV